MIGNAAHLLFLSYLIDHFVRASGTVTGNRHCGHCGSHNTHNAGTVGSGAINLHGRMSSGARSMLIGWMLQLRCANKAATVSGAGWAAMCGTLYPLVG